MLSFQFRHVQTINTFNVQRPFQRNKYLTRKWRGNINNQSTKKIKREKWPANTFSPIKYLRIFFLILHSVAEDMFTAGKRVNT